MGRRTKKAPTSTQSKTSLLSRDASKGEKGAITTEIDFPSLVKRGSLVRLKRDEQAIVISNNIQNEITTEVIVVPLERRTSRLNAPFAVDLGRAEGLRSLHSARCDRIKTIKNSEIIAIERAELNAQVLSKLEDACRVALGFQSAL